MVTFSTASASASIWARRASASLLQCFDRRDAQDVAFKLARQFVVLQHDVERLVPRHVIQDDRQGSIHVRIEHDVQSADLVDQAEEIFQVNIFQVYRDRLARVLRTVRRRRSATSGPSARPRGSPRA